MGGYGQFNNSLSNNAVMIGDVFAINARLYGYVYLALAMLDNARVVATVANIVAYRMRCFHCATARGNMDVVAIVISLSALLFSFAIIDTSFAEV
jgi:hypothetical protein